MANPSISTTAAAANQDAASEHFQGVDIAKILRSKGPVVSVVVLRCSSSKDAKPSAQASNNLLPELIDQVQIDTTPNKSEIEQLLGGPFTFVGQYEEEGIMLMARRGQVFATDDDNDESMPSEERLPRNPHKLQPPFAGTCVFGDIVCMKVAEVDDPLHDDDENADHATKPTTVDVASNEEFFLDYTKEQYLKFAARTDVVAPVLPVENVEAEEQFAGSDDEEDAGEWSGQEDEDDDDDDGGEEEAQGAMMQLVLATVLKQFQEQNGREPDEQELAVLKLTVAHKLGAMMGTIQEADESEEDEENASVQDESSASASTAVASPASSTGLSPGTDSKRNIGKSTLEGVDGEPTAKKIKVDVHVKDG